MTNKMAYVIGNLKFVHILTVFLELLRMIHANIIQINGTILMTPFLGHPVVQSIYEEFKTVRVSGPNPRIMVKPRHCLTVPNPG